MSAAADPLVIVAGGGTGGHLFPGLALAEALRARGVRVEFLGTANGIEARVVPTAGFPIHLLAGRQLRGGGPLRAVAGVASLARGTGRALGLLGRLRPGLVVGVGGYASVAAVVAAFVRRLPIVLLEQNVIPGAANRLLGRIGSRICVGFAETVPCFPPGRAVHTGNPIRASTLTVPRPRRDRPAVLVFGGSGGAHHVNTATLEAVQYLGERMRTFDLLHQTGRTDADTVRARYAALGLPVRVEAFIDDMGSAYAGTDVVVARAGAMTCAEVTALGLPSILIPYPFAADDHQRRNAEVLVAAGAAEMITDRELDGARLGDAILQLVGDTAHRETMAARARAFGRPDAAATVAAECLRLLATREVRAPLEERTTLL